MSVGRLVLVIEDETILANAISVYLERHGFATAVAHSGADGLRLAEETSPDVAVVDIRLPDIDGLEVLRELRAGFAGTEVVMTTAYASVASALEAMKLGAADYLTKPVDLEKLLVVIDKAVSEQRMRRELSYWKGRDAAGGRVSEIVGESPVMTALRAQIERVASFDSPVNAGPTVLVRGETGSGKEMVARAIHYQGPRAAAAFVEINCAAIPAALLEAELFGYEKGAYTDAKSAKPGLFEAAEGGTLFLDEIGHVESAVQVKLLKAIEDKTVRRVGAVRTKSVNVRIITATNRDLEAAIAEGAFRADLYYRLHALTIDVPPLRGRGEDILVLADHFLRTFSRQYGLPVKNLPPEARGALLAYPWPGNVRELAHMMERAVLLHAGDVVTVEQLGLPARKRSAPVVVGSEGVVAVDFSSTSIVLEDVERALITEGLRAAGWNRARASELLGLSRETLRYRIEKYRLRPPAEPETSR
jgi:DNA-binding NtrC family response regulator